MEIIYKNPNIMSFKDLNRGDVFRYKNWLYMKIECWDKKDNNTVYLEGCTGMLTRIDNEEIVEKVHCKLITEN